MFKVKLSLSKQAISYDFVYIETIIKYNYVKLIYELIS